MVLLLGRPMAYILVLLYLPDSCCHPNQAFPVALAYDLLLRHMQRNIEGKACACPSASHPQHLSLSSTQAGSSHLARQYNGHVSL